MIAILIVSTFFPFCKTYPDAVNGTVNPAAINAIIFATGMSIIGAIIIMACDLCGIINCSPKILKIKIWTRILYLTD
jgi:hypothetical protein